MTTAHVVHHSTMLKVDKVESFDMHLINDDDFVSHDDVLPEVDRRPEGIVAAKDPLQPLAQLVHDDQGRMMSAEGNEHANDGSEESEGDKSTISGSHSAYQHQHRPDTETQNGVRQPQHPFPPPPPPFYTHPYAYYHPPAPPHAPFYSQPPLLPHAPPPPLAGGPPPPPPRLPPWRGSMPPRFQHPSHLPANHHGYRDASGIPDPTPDTRRNRGGVTEPFPQKLHRLLAYAEQEGMTDIVSFFSHGRAFSIHKPKLFVAKVMKHFFRQTRLTSFQRQLNLYGFKRISQGPDNGGYYHELFLKGRPGLCINMKRTKVKGNNKLLRKDSESEPNFYAMPAVGGGHMGVLRPPASPATSSSTTPPSSSPPLVRGPPPPPPPMYPQYPYYGGYHPPAPYSAAQTSSYYPPYPPHSYGYNYYPPPVRPPPPSSSSVQPHDSEQGQSTGESDQEDEAAREDYNDNQEEDADDFRPHTPCGANEHSNSMVGELEFSPSTVQSPFTPISGSPLHAAGVDTPRTPEEDRMFACP